MAAHGSIGCIAVERFGPYRLEQTINVGSIGEVFLAWRDDPAPGDGARDGSGAGGREHDPTEPQLMVVKRLHRELARRPAHVALFEQEGRMARRFSHAHLVHAFDAGTVERDAQGPDYYIAMDLVRGPNLAQRRPHRAVSPAAGLRLGVELCAGLDHMHQAGVVHCDVSPTNILLGPAVAQLTDFGVANPVGQPQPQVRGTLPYMSPEQARGEQLDGRSDLFSLAVVLWELLAGRPLFLRDAPYLTLTAVVEDPVPSWDRPELAAVESILARALAKDPAERFAQATELAAALSQALQDLTL